MRFYDVNEGSIRIEGHDIREFSRDDLRSLFGMVLQDTWLYNDTIMENIRYGRLDASDEEVIAAARAAQADHFIRTLPESYQMVLNEEATNVSQGQKQLLTIARAILSDPKILILDEATSSVDTRTEILIQRAMDHLMEGRTSFVIAHRLSTIRNADLILCVDNGNIVEQGTHEELLQGVSTPTSTTVSLKKYQLYKGGMPVKGQLRHKVVYRSLQFLLKPFITWKFNYRFERSKPLDHPAFILSNHVTNWDPLLVGLGFPKMMYYVASDHLFRLGWLSSILRFLVAPIPRIKSTADRQTVAAIFRLIKEGHNICIVPEGNITFSGETGELHGTTARLIKRTGAALVTYRMEGGYLTEPRWSRFPRRGVMYGYPVKVYLPDEIRAMSEEEMKPLKILYQRL